MADRFDSFVVLAEMRTGSNFFEENLNAIDGLTCYGEAFNPYFIGHKDDTALLGVTLEQREVSPDRLLSAMRTGTDGLPGFRLFSDHDPRVIDMVLSDPRCAKIVLTRNPLDSYVSLKIASQTGQWKLTDMKDRKAARVSFNTAEFEQHLDRIHCFQVEVLHRMQVSGQSAFYVAYEDIGDIEVLNGLAQWLGATGRLEHVSGNLKRQNPAPLSEKVLNYDAMVEALARIDRFDLTRTPNFEPRRGPAVPNYVAAAKSPLLFMPLAGGPVDQVEAWLTEVDGGALPLRGFSQKTLRQWKRRNPHHRSFTVVSHPVERAYRAFHDMLTQKDEQARAARGALRRTYGIALPKALSDPEYDADAHRAAFVGFVRFLKGNIAGQTSLRTQPSWSTQTNILQGMAQLQSPDMVMRAERLAEDLALIAGITGSAMPGIAQPVLAGRFALADIYDAQVEEAVSKVYQRDYMSFGYRSWDAAAG